jgi:hypothetical protein
VSIANHEVFNMQEYTLISAPTLNRLRGANVASLVWSSHRQEFIFEQWVAGTYISLTPEQLLSLAQELIEVAAMRGAITNVVRREA